jgi:hypothetical protein
MQPTRGRAGTQLRQLAPSVPDPYVRSKLRLVGRILRERMTSSGVAKPHKARGRRRPRQQSHWCLWNPEQRRTRHCSGLHRLQQRRKKL